MATAKIFWSGGSQAVRLPREFRVNGEEVRIRRHGSAIILEPLPNDWAWLDSLVMGTLDQDFIAAVNERDKPQERLELDQLFWVSHALSTGQERRRRAAERLHLLQAGAPDLINL